MGRRGVVTRALWVVVQEEWERGSTGCAVGSGDLGEEGEEVWVINAKLY